MYYRYSLTSGVTKVRTNTKKYLAAAVTGVAAAGLMAAPAFAAPAVMNGSFETGTDPGVFTTLVAGDSTSIPGWTVTAGSVDYIGTYWNSSDGVRDLDMSGLAPGQITQTLATVAGHSYAVGFDLAGNPDGAPVVKMLDVDTGGAAMSYMFDTTGHSRADMGWEHHTYSFTASGASTVLRFTSSGSNNTFYGAALDNVTVALDAPITANQCKNDGWKDYGVFKNQGDCVSFVATGGKNLPAGV